VSAISIGGSHPGFGYVTESLSLRLVRSAVDRGGTFTDKRELRIVIPLEPGQPLLRGQQARHGAVRVRLLDGIRLDALDVVRIEQAAHVEPRPVEPRGAILQPVHGLERRRAVELRVAFVDTADSCGPFVSENLLAQVLHPLPEGLVIATQGEFEPPGPDPWVPNGQPDYLRRCLEGSLRRLKLERIDHWQFHRVDPRVPTDEQFGVLAEFVREGMARLAGLSEVGVEQVEAARRVVPIASVQNRYDIIDSKWESVLQHCECERIAFIPWFPLGAGSIGTREEARAAEKRLERVAARHGANVRQVALAWLLARR
jgi:aryl-alcohol dehydrogenase-like predicted oxidoreductase